MDTKSTLKSGEPLVITSETKSKFEEYYPHCIGLIELYVKEGIIVIKNEGV